MQTVHVYENGVFVRKALAASLSARSIVVKSGKRVALGASDTLVAGKFDASEWSVRAVKAFGGPVVKPVAGVRGPLGVVVSEVAPHVDAPYGTSAKTGKPLTAQQSLMSHGKCKAQPKAVVDVFRARVSAGHSLALAASSVLGGSEAVLADPAARTPRLESGPGRMARPTVSVSDADKLRVIAGMLRTQADLIEAMIG